MKHALVLLALVLFVTGSAQVDLGHRRGVGDHVGNPEWPVKPLARYRHASGDIDLALWEVRRSGETLIVKFSYENLTRQQKQIEHLDGYLLDETGTKYPLTAAERHGKNGEVLFLAPLQTLKTWAKFAAPPKGTKTISIYIPGVVFENVPLK